VYKQWFAIAGIFGVYGTLFYTWPWAFVWSLIPTYGMAMPFTTVYQHRFMTHGAMKMKKWLKQVFETAGYCCVGPNTLEWVGAHTAHHKWSDSEKDPHTPRWVKEQDGTYRVAQGMEGLFPAIMPLNVVAWGRWIKENQHLIPQFAPQVVRSETPWIKWMRRHKYLGLLTGTCVLALLTWLVHGNPFIGLAAAACATYRTNGLAGTSTPGLKSP
jgi:fatty-acid desaturase